MFVKFLGLVLIKKSIKLDKINKIDKVVKTNGISKFYKIRSNQ